MNERVEDMKDEPLTKEGLPKLKKLPTEKRKKKKDGMDKAMKIIDEYMEGVPEIDPNTPNYEE